MGKHNIGVRENFRFKVLQLIYANLFEYGTNTLTYQEMAVEWDMSLASISYHVLKHQDELEEVGIYLKRSPLNYKCKLLALDVEKAMGILGNYIEGN